jgi:hypothetical protein
MMRTLAALALIAAGTAHAQDVQITPPSPMWTTIHTYWVGVVEVENYGSLVSADGFKGECEAFVQRTYHMMRTEFPHMKVGDAYCYRVIRDETEAVKDNGQ